MTVWLLLRRYDKDVVSLQGLKILHQHTEEDDPLTSKTDELRKLKVLQPKAQTKLQHLKQTHWC